MLFWNETLETLSKISSKERFVFKIQKKEYEVPLAFAIYLCPLISELLFINPTLKSIRLYTDDSKSQFINILEGKSVDPSFFYLIAEEMNNQKMIEQYFLTIKDTNNSINLNMNQHVIEKIKITNQFQSRISHFSNDEIDYFANHFEQIKYDILKMNIDVIIKILTNSNLKIDSEDSLWNIIKQKLTEINKSTNNNQSLLQYIDVHNLSNKNLKEFLEMIKDIRSIDQKTWSTIIKCLFSFNNISLNKFNKSIEDGIFKYLNEICGGNAYLKGLIDIQTTSTNCLNPEVVIHPSSQYWYSRDAPNQWIMFDFKDKKVEMASYFLQTYDNDPDYGHLKNWIIEGTNDIKDENWIRIDEQLNNSDLNGPSFKKVYSVSSNQYFRYIRLRGCGCNHRDENDYDLVLSQFEIFGKLTFS